MIQYNLIAFQVFCQECYEAGSDHCPSCGRALDGHSVRVNGSSFHSDCFVCCVCKKKMVNIPFVADDKNQVLLTVRNNIAKINEAWTL